MKRAIGSALLCLTFTLPVAAEDEVCKRKVSVTGRAEASHAPDFIALTLATETKAADVAGALDASNKSIAAIGTLARELGVGEGDVRTASVVLENAYRKVSRTLGADEFEPDGFRVRNLVSVRLLDRNKAGEFVRRALGVNGVKFETADLGLANPRQAEAALLVAAGKDARAQAERLAEAAGGTVGVICSLSAGKVQEMRSMPSPEGRVKKSRDYGSYGGYDEAEPRKGLYIPLEAGTIDLSAEVSAEFAAQL